MGLLDRVAREIEARAGEIVGAYMAAGMGGDWRALEALVTRVHGKPVERVELGQVDAAGVQAMSDAELEQLIAKGEGLRLVPGTPDVHREAQSQ